VGGRGSLGFGEDLLAEHGTHRQSHPAPAVGQALGQGAPTCGLHGQLVTDLVHQIQVDADLGRWRLACGSQPLPGGYGGFESVQLVLHPGGLDEQRLEDQRVGQRGWTPDGPEAEGAVLGRVHEDLEKGLGAFQRATIDRADPAVVGVNRAEWPPPTIQDLEHSIRIRTDHRLENGRQIKVIDTTAQFCLLVTSEVGEGPLQTSGQILEVMHGQIAGLEEPPQDQGTRPLEGRSPLGKTRQRTERGPGDDLAFREGGTGPPVGHRLHITSRTTLSADLHHPLDHEVERGWKLARSEENLPVTVAKNLPDLGQRHPLLIGYGVEKATLGDELDKIRLTHLQGLSYPNSVFRGEWPGLAAPPADTMEAMVSNPAAQQAFQRVLTEDLRPPAYLTPEEVRGGWQELFPELASSLPAPYPIFGTDEEKIITYGYPILISEGIWKLRRELDKLVLLETTYRLGGPGGETTKDHVAAQRDRYERATTTIIENVLMNDYGRGLIEVFLLFHSGDVVRGLGQVPKQIQLNWPNAGRDAAEETRQFITGVFGELIQRSAVRATESLKRLADGPSGLRISPVLTAVCNDKLLLSESQAPASLERLSGYFRHRLKQDPKAFINASEKALRRLADLIRRHPEIGSLLSTSGAGRLRLDQVSTLLDPALLNALESAKLTSTLDLSIKQVRFLRELGLRLKSFELLATLRRRIQPMERRGSQLVLAGASSATAIAPSTRPFDFASPGVVESLVRRCGLVYDLTNFTSVLEAVRKQGRAAEEKALQFMYVFQNRLDEIRRRRILNFEKFLGDGALYSSRRAVRVLAAACEIQLVYDHLRSSGFPFDQGIRIALNFGTYRLLPMFNRGTGPLRFEFFGHGIVELARLTTGKSTRELEEIAEFLVHAGYDPDRVDTFLAPLMEARSGHGAAGSRRYAATIDSRGELINEGVVLTAQFLEELDKDLEGSPVGAVNFDGLDWATIALDPSDPDTIHVGLRLLGVARLKGLSPQELVEAVVWEQLPSEPRSVGVVRNLLQTLRRVAAAPSKDRDEENSEEPEETIPANLVAITYLDKNDQRDWIFGMYRESDDLVMNAVQVPIQTPELGRDEPLETWLFRNRHELARLYEGVRRSTAGSPAPLSSLRGRNGFLACFLTAPHRAPGRR